MRAGLPTSSGGKKNSNCCCGAGRGQRPVKVRCFCSPARPGSVSPGSRRRCWKASLPSHIRDCAISAPPSTPTARFIRSSARWNVLPDWRTMTPRKRGSTNSMRCWRRPLPPSRTRPSLPSCCRCRTMDATLALAPQQRRQKTLEALTAQMETLSRQSPVLMIFEDAHWIDPTSLEALGRAVGRIATLRVLLIVTFRPEFEPPWIGRPHVTALTINRLAQCDIDAMIDRVVGNKTLPASVRQDIVERTDGIPLFVEEMTKAVLEAENEGQARRTVAAVPVPSPGFAVPASLHASL